MWQETLKRKKRTIRSFTTEYEATAPLHRLNNLWFIVTKKDATTGNSSKYLIAYESETGHYFSLGKDEEDLIKEIENKVSKMTVEKINDIIRAYSLNSKTTSVETAQGTLLFE